MKTKTPKLSDTDQVTAHIQKLEPQVAEVIEAIRQSILQVHPTIAEHIKWNNPSFYYNGPMKPFDPKEYKRDIAVMNLYKGRIMLVFPSGAKVNDPSGLLQGNYADGRRTCVFKDLTDFKNQEQHLHSILLKWLSLIEE